MSDALREFKNAVQVRKVVAKFKSAKEFTSPDALSEYLKEHPKADKSKHTVVDEDTAKLKKDLKDYQKIEKGQSDARNKRDKRKDEKSKKDLDKWKSDFPEGSLNLKGKD